VRTIQMPAEGPDAGAAFVRSLISACEHAWPRPRMLLLSFPHNPTGACVDATLFTDVIDVARRFGMTVVHDFSYADIAFDGHEPPSILQVPGARDVAVEIVSFSKSYSMAGWRIGLCAGNAEVVAGLSRLKSYLDYGVFQPIQIAATVALNECAESAPAIRDIYRRRRDVLCEGLGRAGWQVSPPRGTMFVWARIPGDYAHLGSLEFSKLLLREAGVAVAPGVGFGPSGDGHVRFALVENEARIRQATRGIRRVLRNGADAWTDAAKSRSSQSRPAG